MEKEKEREEKNFDLKQSFETQFKSDLPTELQRTTCGITSLTIALKYLFQEQTIDPYDLLISYINQGKYNRETIGYSTQIRGKEVKIPIAYRLPSEEQFSFQKKSLNLLKTLNCNTNQPLKRLDSEDNKYIPSFTLANGFDHRGVKLFLKRYPVNVETTEETSLENIFSQLENTRSVALLSCNHEQLGYPLHYKILNSSPAHIPTHVICAFNSANIGGSKVINFADPAFLNSSDGIQTRTLESLNNAYNNIATIITRND